MNILERAQALNATRNTVWTEAQGFLSDLPKDQEMSVEQRTQWDRYNARIDSLGAERDELIERARIDGENEGIRNAQEIAFGADVDPDAERFDANVEIRSFLRGEKRFDTHDDDGKPVNAIRADVMAVARERDLLRMGASPSEIRALAWDTGSVASAVPTVMARSLYEILEANIAALRMPTTRITSGSGEPMTFPKVTAHGIATQVSGQGTAFAGTDPTFNLLSLTPNKYGELVKLANEVVSDTGVDIVGFVSRDIGRAVGRQINTAIMTEVIGSAFTGAAGTASTGGSLVGPTFSNLVDLEYSVNDAYRSSSSAGWLMNDSTAGAVRKLRDGAGGTEGAPLWQPSLQGGIAGLRTPDTLFGYPVFTDPNIAALASNSKSIFFGDWAGYYVRTVGSLMIERNDSVFFATDEVGFRGKWRSASGAQDLTAINVMKSSVS